MKEILFRNAPYLEDGELAHFLCKYKTKGNKVFIHTGFEYGGEVWVNAIIDKIRPTEFGYNEIVFWHFDKLSKEAFWTKRTHIACARKIHRDIPIKHIVYGVVIVSNEEFKKCQFNKFTIEVVD